MKESQEQKQRREELSGEAMDTERRKNERREQESRGYAYIEMVGWMDRRERVRRGGNGFSD